MLYVATTSWAVTSLPSENLALGSIRNQNVRESSATFQWVASFRSNSKFSEFRPSRFSYTRSSMTPFNWDRVSFPNALNVLGKTSSAALKCNVSPFMEFSSPYMIGSSFVFQPNLSAINSKPSPPS